MGKGYPEKKEGDEYMFKKLLAKGIEKVAEVLGFDTKALREELAAYCESLVGSKTYFLRFRADDGEVSSWTFIDGNNTPVDVPDDFSSKVRAMLDKHINRKRYRLNLAIKNGELETVSVQDGLKPDSELDFKNKELNQSYKSFRKAFDHLQDTVSDNVGGDGCNVEILSSHLEEISDKIDEIEAICD